MLALGPLQEPGGGGGEHFKYWPNPQARTH